MEHQKDLLHRIWKRSAPGLVFLPFRDRNGWHESEAFLSDQTVFPRDGEWGDQYFTPSTYKFAERLAQNIAPMGVLYADLDGDYDPEILEVIPPSVLWQTSPGNLQAIWYLERPTNPEYALDLNRRLSHLVEADHGSWIPTKVLRIPGTYNLKRDSWGELIWDRDIEYNPFALGANLPHVPKLISSARGPIPMTPTKSQHTELLHKHWPHIDHRTKLMLSEGQVSDRSLHLSKVAARLAAISVPPEEIFQILSLLPSNKFLRRPEVLWNSVVITAVNRGK